MKGRNIIQEKSFEFAVKTIKLVRYLQEIKKEFVISNQLLKAACSVGANIEEAIGGQSKKDFIAKISIAYKEAREANYWIRLLENSQIVNSVETNDLLIKSEECCKILSSILVTLKSGIQMNKKIS